MSSPISKTESPDAPFNRNLQSNDTNEVADTETFSSSVRTDLKNIIAIEYSGKANIEQLVTALHRIHREYAPKNFTGFIDFLAGGKSADRDYPSHDFDEWLNVSQQNVNKSATAKRERIHGRVFLSSIILIEYRKLYGFFQEPKKWRQACQNLINELENEIQSKFDVDLKDILTADGLANREFLFQSEGDLEDLSNRDDMPTDDDLLSRDALSNFLAKRIRYIYRKQKDGTSYKNSFFIHVDGKWGSGKSTFLRFLKKHLAEKVPPEEEQQQESDEWIVAEFNAWQNQRLDPPWWYIIQSVYTAALQDLWKRNKKEALKFKFREQLWRLNTGRNFVASALLTLLLFICAISFGITSDKDLKGNQLFTYVAGLLSLGGFIWSLSGWLRTSLISGSGKTAREFIEQNSNDPMKVLNEHYGKMINRTGYPVALFIDDLDRCNKDYGIKLLEGLQTIFKSAPVVYVIAADGKWLNTMYESNYAIFSGAVAQPGKSFGTIFMDKTFQLKVDLPEINNRLKENYWNYLLGLDKKGRDEKLKKAESNASEQLSGLSGNQEILTKARQEKDPVISQKIKEMALGKMSISQEDKFFENRLQSYLSLIDNNPRSMKRLVNTLSIERALRLIGNNADISDEELILWTILKMQYPLVSEYVWKYPSVLSNSKDLPGKPVADFADLFRDSSVQNLLKFNVHGKAVELNEKFIKSMKQG